jgi:hypothetical protein
MVSPQILDIVGPVMQPFDTSNNGKNIIDTADDFGHTALISEVSYTFASLGERNIVSYLSSIEQILEAGADIDAETTKQTVDIPSKVTALWMAAEKAEDIRVVTLLLRYGAKCPPTLSETGKKKLVQAYSELVQRRQTERQELQLYVTDHGAPFPTTLLDKIQDYLFPDYNEQLIHSEMPAVTTSKQSTPSFNMKWDKDVYGRI